MAWRAVEERIPVDPGEPHRPRAAIAERRVEHEQPQHARDGRRDRIGPDQQVLKVGAARSCLSACVASSSAQDSDRAATRVEKTSVVDHGAVVFGLGEQRPVVLEADELASTARTRPPAGRTARAPGGRPVEEDERDRELRQPAARRAEAVIEKTARFSMSHSLSFRGSRARTGMAPRRGPGSPSGCRGMTAFSAPPSARTGAACALPRATAASSASLADFCPASAALDLLRPDVAQLHHVAEAKPARILGRLLVGELEQRRLEDGVLLVEARALVFS